MLVPMILMTAVLRSTLGVLSIVAALGACVRAARTDHSARAFLVDSGAMPATRILPFLHAEPMSMPGMAGTSLGGGAAAAIVLLVSVAARAALGRLPVARGQRVGSALFAGCCALGLVIMLVI